MSDQPIIVVKKVKKSHGSHHGGAWKVAYADFVTAMMALFIVLWILGQDSETKQMVSAYFQDPKAFEQAVAAGLYSQETADKENYNTDPILTPSAEPTEVYVNNEENSEENNKEKIKLMAEKLMADINSMPEFDKLKDKVNIQIGDKMAIIELVEPEGSYFFDISDANMKPQAKKLLGVIAMELNKLPNKIVIAGHTDSRPFLSDHYTNWELSADRANSARRVMELYGFNPSKIIEVKGCADKFLKYPETPENPMNRRITIIVMFEDTNVDMDNFYSTPGNKEKEDGTHKEDKISEKDTDHKDTEEHKEDKVSEKDTDHKDTEEPEEDGDNKTYKIYEPEEVTEEDTSNSH